MLLKLLYIMHKVIIAILHVDVILIKGSSHYSDDKMAKIYQLHFRSPTRRCKNKYCIYFSSREFGYNMICSLHHKHFFFLCGLDNIESTILKSNIKIMYHILFSTILKFKSRRFVEICKACFIKLKRFTLSKF